MSTVSEIIVTDDDADCVSTCELLFILEQDKSFKLFCLWLVSSCERCA